MRRFAPRCDPGIETGAAAIQRADTVLLIYTLAVTWNHQIIIRSCDFGDSLSHVTEFYKEEEDLRTDT